MKVELFNELPRDKLIARAGEEIVEEKSQVQQQNNIREEKAYFKENKIHDEQIDRKYLKDAIEKLNEALEIFNKRIRLAVHEEVKRISVKIIDSETEKVIREIPPKEVLDLIKRIHQVIGIFIDEKR